MTKTQPSLFDQTAHRRGRVLVAIQGHRNGLTDAEGAGQLGMSLADYSALRRRLVELGVVVAGSVRRDGVRTWRAK